MEIDTETAKYIINYFSHLLTAYEGMAVKNIIYSYKLSDAPESRINAMKEKGWISTNPAVTDLLKDGAENFELNVARRILSQFKAQVFLNTCPKCEKLARTPQAKQCRHCGHQWHNSHT